MTNLPKQSMDIISTLDEEIVVVTLLTLERLFEINPDAVTLYMFYVMTAKKQAAIIGKTERIKATREYCRTALHWGTTTFHEAKNLLLENNFIEDIIMKNEKGNVVSAYVKVNYLIKTQPQNPGVSNETGGSYNPGVSNETTNVYIPKIYNKHTNNVTVNDVTPTNQPEVVDTGNDTDTGLTQNPVVKPSQAIFLLNVPTESIQRWQEKWTISEKDIREQGERAYNWLLGEGKTQKNYEAFLRNWLQKRVDDGRIRPEKHIDPKETYLRELAKRGFLGDASVDKIINALPREDRLKLEDMIWRVVET